MNNIKQKDNFIILTGAMGAGKSAVISRLKQMNIKCVDEPARQILAEQRLIGGTGVPETDPKLFTELMLSRTTFQYGLYFRINEPVFFDRGMPDFIAYANAFNIENRTYRNASSVYRFNSQVFFFEAWEEIYTNDDERKMSFEMSCNFGNDVKAIYEKCGYKINPIPFTDVEGRVEYILNSFNKIKKDL